MVRSFIFQTLLQQPNASSLVQMILAKELKNKWKKPEDTSEFYVTVEESMMLVQDIQKKFFANCEQEFEQIFKDTGDPSMGQLPVVQKRIVEEYIFGVEDWMKHMNRCVRSLTSFAKFAPNRVFYIKYIQLFPFGSVKKELYANSGEFLEVLKILLDQRSGPVSREELDLYEKLTRGWLSGSGWVYMRVEEIQKTLQLFSVDSKRIIFVPEIRSFFRGVLKNGLGDIPKDQKKPKTPEADGELVKLKAACDVLLAERDSLQKKNDMLVEDLKKQELMWKANDKEHAEQLCQKQKQNDALARKLETAKRDMDKIKADLKRVTVQNEQMER